MTSFGIPPSTCPEQCSWHSHCYHYFKLDSNKLVPFRCLSWLPIFRFSVRLECLPLECHMLNWTVHVCSSSMTSVLFYPGFARATRTSRTNGRRWRTGLLLMQWLRFDDTDMVIMTHRLIFYLLIISHVIFVHILGQSWRYWRSWTRRRCWTNCKSLPLSVWLLLGFCFVNVGIFFRVPFEGLKHGGTWQCKSFQSKALSLLPPFSSPSFPLYPWYFWIERGTPPRVRL